MTERTALGAAIEKHWRKHRPRMVKELGKSGQLQKAVMEAQELTGDLLYELVSVRKMDYQAAWELASREWALLEPEASYQKKKGGKRSPRVQPAQAKAGGATRTKKRSPGKSAGKRQAMNSSRSRKRRRRRGTSG